MKELKNREKNYVKIGSKYTLIFRGNVTAGQCFDLVKVRVYSPQRVIYILLKKNEYLCPV